jgi:hypothetical protein
VGAEHDVLHHHGETGVGVSVGDLCRERVAETELAHRLGRRIGGSHVDPSVDHHPPEQVTAHVHGLVQPLGQRLRDRRLARRLNAGHQEDRHVSNRAIVHRRPASGFPPR